MSDLMRLARAACADSGASPVQQTALPGCPADGVAGATTKGRKTTKGAPDAPVGMARCSACAHFQTRPGETPDGWCTRHEVETWAAPLFQCGAYRPADAALVALARRRAAVVKQLQAEPALRYAFAVQGASPIVPASGPVSVVLALRDSTGAIVTGEVVVPADRWPGVAVFTAYWRDAAERKPS